MAVGIVIITHDGIGDALLATASSVFSGTPLHARAFAVTRDADPDRCFHQAVALAGEVDAGDGLLVLSDLYGSTPGNVAARVAAALGGRLVCGLNLPMLLRIFNYPDLPLTELVDKAVDGGRAGVVS